MYGCWESESFSGEKRLGRRRVSWPESSVLTCLLYPKQTPSCPRVPPFLFSTLFLFTLLEPRVTFYLLSPPFAFCILLFWGDRRHVISLLPFLSPPPLPLYWGLLSSPPKISLGQSFSLFWR